MEDSNMLRRFKNIHPTWACLRRMGSVTERQSGAERETMGDEGRGIDTALSYETKYLGAVAAVHPTCLEYQVLAVHVGQWKDLGTGIHGDNGHYGIGTGTLPGHAEGFLRTGHFQDGIGSSVSTQTRQCSGSVTVTPG